MPAVNLYVVSRHGEGARLLWRNVPLQTAQRICAMDCTASRHTMLVWSYCDSLGLHPSEPVVDDGRWDYLLDDADMATIQCWDGSRWRKKSLRPTRQAQGSSNGADQGERLS